MPKALLILINCMALHFAAAAQSGPDVIINLLGTPDIPEVNIDQDKFFESAKGILDMVNNDFKGTPKNQKIALLLTAHKSGKPTFELFSAPKLAAIKEQFYAGLTGIYTSTQALRKTWACMILRRSFTGMHWFRANTQSRPLTGSCIASRRWMLL